MMAIAHALIDCLFFSVMIYLYDKRMTLLEDWLDELDERITDLESESDMADRDWSSN